MKLPSGFERINQCMWDHPTSCTNLAAFINREERAWLCREHLAVLTAYYQVASVPPEDLSPIAREVQAKRIAILGKVFPDDRPTTFQDLLKKASL